MKLEDGRIRLIFRMDDTFSRPLQRFAFSRQMNQTQLQSWPQDFLLRAACCFFCVMVVNNASKG